MISLFVLKFNASFLENMRKLTIQSFNKKEPLFFKFSFISFSPFFLNQNKIKVL